MHKKPAGKRSFPPKILCSLLILAIVRRVRRFWRAQARRGELRAEQELDEPDEKHEHQHRDEAGRDEHHRERL